MCGGGISYRGKLTVATPLKDVFCSSHKPFAVNNSSGKDWVAQPLPHPWWIIDRYSFAQITTDDVSSWVWQPCHAQEILCFTILPLILQHLHSSHLLFCKFHEASQLRVGVGWYKYPICDWALNSHIFHLMIHCESLQSLEPTEGKGFLDHG